MHSRARTVASLKSRYRLRQLLSQLVAKPRAARERRRATVGVRKPQKPCRAQPGPGAIRKPRRGGRHRTPSRLIQRSQMERLLRLGIDRSTVTRARPETGSADAPPAREGRDGNFIGSRWGPAILARKSKRLAGSRKNMLAGVCMSGAAGSGITLRKDQGSLGPGRK